ncbi:MAG: hypothetical protein WEB53_15885, partial [Akkermansiaceae bacterium]
NTTGVSLQTVVGASCSESNSSELASVAINGATVAAAGTSGVDNFVVSGIPEFASALLGTIGLLGLLHRRR